MLYALSLVQAMETAPSTIIDLEADAPYLSRVVPSVYAYQALELINLDFSLDSHAYKDETNIVTISAFAQIEYSPMEDIPYPGFLFSRLTFDSDRREWTHIGSHAAGWNVSHTEASIQPELGISRAGRMLALYRCRESNKKWRGLVAVDSGGSIIFPRLSVDFASVADEWSWPDEPDILLHGIEPSSGTLIRLKDRRTGRDVIELYRET